MHHRFASSPSRRRARIAPAVALVAIGAQVLGPSARVVRAADVEISTAVTGAQTGQGGLFTITPTGSVTNTSGVAVTASTGNEITTLTNDNLVSGSTQGLFVDGTTMTALVNNGRLEATTLGSWPNYTGAVVMRNLARIDSLTNTGTISGGDYGIDMYGTNGIGALVNSGTIVGNQYGVSNESGTIDSILNQAGAVIRGTNDTGLTGDGDFGSIDNHGTIEGDYGTYFSGMVTSFVNRSTGVVRGNDAQGMRMSGVGSFLNEAGGLIEGLDGYGVELTDNLTGTFTNRGTIRGTGASGLYWSYDVPSIVNSGTIQGYHGMEHDGGTLGAFTNEAGGLIQGDDENGYYLNTESSATFVNHGTITGSDIGFYAYYGMTGTFTNKSGGVLSGTNSAGFFVDDDLGTIINEASGTISSTNGAGVLVSSSGYTPGSLTNAGLITGKTEGVRVQDGSLTSLVNSGTISSTGVGSPGLTAHSGSAIGSFVNQGVVMNGIRINSGNFTVSAGGGGGTFTNGTLQVNGGNLTFTNGQTTLDADISVNGGSGTVFNNATLRLKDTQVLTGKLEQSAGGKMLMALLGIGTGQYGRLDISGSGTFAGYLELDDTGLLGGLAAGQTFDLFNYASRTGGFSGLLVNGTALSSLGGGIWSYGSLLLTEQWTGSSMSLSISAAVPEIDPAGMGSVLALVVGSLGVLERRRRRTA